MFKNINLIYKKSNLIKRYLSSEMKSPHEIAREVYIN